MQLLHYPTDNGRLRMKYEGKSGGVCGPAAIAALEHVQVQEIIDAWTPVPFHGCAPIGELVATLKALGYDTVRKRGNKARLFPFPSTDRAVVRVQWLKPGGEEYFWREASRYSHYVAMRKDPGTGRWWVYCNSMLWFHAHGSAGEEYLNARGRQGYVSSYVELRRP